LHTSSRSDSLKLHLRTRVETFKGSRKWDEVVIERTVPAGKTAIIICDMWDKHWCEGASRRCDELAARMAPVIDRARSQGVQIIHSPSDTMNFYSDRPQRQRMILAAEIPLPEPLTLSDPKLPIDDSDGGCDTGQKPWHRAWTRENTRINIAQGDAISDNGKEIYNFLKQHAISTILYMGVHTNMCVLNRSFAIKQMTRWGFQCVLVRDLTDTMYDPKAPPYVSHEQGTELVVQHIEKFWCPSILSSDLLSLE
jgi:nicotinamidase-related amidase